MKKPETTERTRRPREKQPACRRTNSQAAHSLFKNQSAGSITGFSRPHGFFAVLTVTALSLAGQVQAAPSLYQLPLSGNEMLRALDRFDNYNGNVGMVLEASTTIEVSVPGTVIVVDHWEDGYEADLSNPLQPTTETWGDGLKVNGAAPGSTDDFLRGREHLATRTTEPIPRNAALVILDGGDRVLASSPVKISRTVEAVSEYTVLRSTAAAVRMDSWTEQARADREGLFMVMAGADDTFVRIDADADGLAEDIQRLLAGESLLVPSLNGGTVQASRPVQVHLLSSAPEGEIACRMIALPGSSEDEEILAADKQNEGVPAMVTPTAPSIEEAGRNQVVTLETAAASSEPPALAPVQQEAPVHFEAAGRSMETAAAAGIMMPAETRQDAAGSYPTSAWKHEPSALSPHQPSNPGRLDASSFGRSTARAGPVPWPGAAVTRSPG